MCRNRLKITDFYCYIIPKKKFHIYISVSPDHTHIICHNKLYTQKCHCNINPIKNSKLTFQYPLTTKISSAIPKYNVPTSSVTYSQLNIPYLYLSIPLPHTPYLLYSNLNSKTHTYKVQINKPNIFTVSLATHTSFAIQNYSPKIPNVT